MTKDELLNRLTDIEWGDFEVKEARTDLPKSIWETVSAFANISGGWVVIGVSQTAQNFIITGVENPGSFPLPIQTLLKTDISQPRNPVLAKLFRNVKLAENAGFGFYKLQMREKLTHTKVDFSSTIAFSLVTFILPSKNDSHENTIIENSTENSINLSKTQRIILEDIRKNPKVSSEDLAKIVGIAAENILQRIDAAKGGYWKINS